MKVLLDSDGIIATIKTEDTWFRKAQEINNTIVQSGGLLYITPTTLAEALTTLQRKYNSRRMAEALYHWLKTSGAQLIAVDEELINLAFEIFSTSQSKKNTIFDAINIAVMKKHQLDAIFSFDSWYKKQGLRLASDLV